MQLNIARPTEKKIMEIVWIDIQTPVGNFVIQPEHAPMIVTLSKNSQITYCLNNGKQESIFVHNGLAHINRKSISLLLNN